MVVLTIIVTVIGFALVTHRTYSYKAMQVEVKQKMNFAFSLVNAWQTETSRQAGEASSAECATEAGERYCVLSSDVRTPDCNVQNDFGFKVTNCHKSNYNARLYHPVGEPQHWRIAFGLKVGSLPGHSTVGTYPDLWYVNACNAQHHAKKIDNFYTYATVIKPATEAYIKCQAH